MSLKAISKKTKLSINELEGIIIVDHVMEKLTPKKKLKRVQVTLRGDVVDFLNKVAKLLKVDVNSVVVFMLQEAIKPGILKESQNIK